MLQGPKAAMESVPDSILRRLGEVEDDFREGCLTEKGYVKKMWAILEEKLSAEQQESLTKLKEDLQQSKISESSYIAEARKHLHLAQRSLTTRTDISTKEGIAGSASTLAASHGKRRPSGEAAAPSPKRSRSGRQATQKPAHRTPTRKSSRHQSATSKIEEDEEGTSMEVTDDDPSASVSSVDDAVEASASGKDETEKDEKQMDVDSDNMSQTSDVPARCDQCHQLLDNEGLKLFAGDSSDAVEEFIALADSRLNVFDDDATGGDDYTEQPGHRITNFTVYDKNMHLCAFDTGLLERNVELYFSGVIKPIYDDNPDPEGGIVAKLLGPINAWWTAGFDGGESALIGFTTGYADYYLMSPSEDYTGIMALMTEKIHLSKLVIEFLEENLDAAYEDLVNIIQTSAPPPELNCTNFSEETLIRHAQFIVEQVESYDSPDDPEETLFIAAPCIRALIKLAGVTLGKRRRGVRHTTKMPRLKKEKKIPGASKATTTPLVRSIFDIFFRDQIDGKASSGPRRTRCGVCDACQLPDCGKCNACRSMVKFGGAGRNKQCCIQRRCPNMLVKEADENDSLDEDDEGAEKVQASSVKKHLIKQTSQSTVQWVGESSLTKEKRKHYKTAKIDKETITIGDCVTLCPNNPSDPLYIACVADMWEDDGNKLFHALWFTRGSETILGETSDPREVFFVDHCDDNPLGAIMYKCDVHIRTMPENWARLGGLEVTDDENGVDGERSFFVQKWYDTDLARFEDPPRLLVDMLSRTEAGLECGACLRQTESDNADIPNAVGQISSEGRKTTYRSVQFKGHMYSVGSAAYFNSAAFHFEIKPSKKIAQPKKREVNEDEYPEYYRKVSYIKGSNLQSPEPFRIGTILEIFTTGGKITEESEDVKLRVRKFYRPENTHRGPTAGYQAAWNLLFWSKEECVLSVKDIEGSCQVVCTEDLTVSIEEYSAASTDNFYFSEAYNAESQEFDEPPTSARTIGSKGKGGGKGKKKSSSSAAESSPNKSVAQQRPLNSLDVFAGCGGLSEGFHASKVAKTCWAIEKDEPAAQAFRLNNPSSTVFTDDCNELLRLVMEGETTNHAGQKLPQKGEVELLCGGPPCQGFSSMNRFNSREYSQFKNSLVSSYLSYCEYYRPRFFVLENVRNFVSFKRSLVLKLTLRCLLRMGYQCTFGVLQAGSYGVPQTRRRAIILAAAPGEVLPLYPEPTHVFSPRACVLSVTVEDKRYMSNISRQNSAPFRTITVRDAMGDLPAIANGASKQHISYSGDPQSHFQTLLRGEKAQVTDHICKDMSDLVVARIEYIPKEPGSDWRDLPNKALRLKDGTSISKLRYTHPDKKNGRSSTKALRGVCSCAAGKPCDPADRQFMTLIPWCLPHTGNRHNHWAGLYGRLEWDGFFSTTITNPEPMGKQGRVLHPEQNRVVSVRECARSQGFPDTYRFYGSILDRHRQVGNAVPPPMAAAIGREIQVSIKKKALGEATA